MLTIGFARRFATYKRADLIMTDLERLFKHLNHPERPVQFIFAGKAHPADEPGKQVIKRIAHRRFDERVRHGPRRASSKTTTSTSAGTWCRASTSG